MKNIAKQRGETEVLRDGNQEFRSRFPEARCLWSEPIGKGEFNVGSITAYSLGRTIVLIHEYADDAGWNAYTPTSDDGRIDATLDAIALRAGAPIGLDVNDLKKGATQ